MLRLAFSLLALVLPFAMLMTMPAAAGAQLDYQRTTFLNGFGSSAQIWNTPYAGLSSSTTPAYLGQTIDLGMAASVSLGDSSTYNQQRDRLRDSLAAQGQRHVLVGHSLGSLVARGTYLRDADRRQNIAGILAVASLYQGAPLAANADAARAFFLDVQRRVNSGVSAMKTEAAVVDFALSFAIKVPFPVLTLYFRTQEGLSIDQIAQLTTLPALQDMKPGSPAIQEQNSRFDDTGIARANVFGSIPFTNAVLRLQASNENDENRFYELQRLRNKGATAFKVCKWVGYGTIVLSPQGRKCHRAQNALKRVDGMWVRFVNGTDSWGLPRYDLPFDGVVPNQNQRYPGLSDPSLNFHVDSGNHQNLFKVRRGADDMVAAMFGMGMRRASGGGGTATTPVSVAISGPNSIGMEGDYTWTAQVSGGSGSYSYQWERSYDGGGSWSSVGTGQSYSRYISGSSSFDLRLTVTSDTQSASDEMYVYVDTSCGGEIC